MVDLTRFYGTRNVLTFVRTTAIASTETLRLQLIFRPYAIAIVFTNVRTLRVAGNVSSRYMAELAYQEFFVEGLVVLCRPRYQYSTVQYSTIPFPARRTKQNVA